MYRDRIVEAPQPQIVYRDRVVEVPAPQIVYKDRVVEVPVTVSQQVVENSQIVVAQKAHWDMQNNSKLPMRTECRGVFKINEATMLYEILSGNSKDYYLTTETQALNQNFTLYKKVIIGDDFEELARSQLRDAGNNNPTKNAMACKIEDNLRPLYEDMARRIVDAKKQPETWIPRLKQEILNAFSH